MGNMQVCSDGCFAWVKGYNQKIKKLRHQYRSHYKQSIFYQNCMNFCEQLHLLARKGHGKNQQDQSQQFKSSLIDSMYQQSAVKLPNNQKENQQDITLPMRITSLTQGQKKRLISDLIKKSYILLDISDIFGQQQTTNSYESHIKHKIFQNDQSIADSFIQRKDALIESLKKFNTITIYKLESYVTMADNIKKSFDADSDSLLSKFLITLKSKLIQNYNSSQIRNIEVLFKNTRELIGILQDTIIILFNIKFCASKNYKNYKDNMSGLGETSSQSSQQQDKQIQFLNQINFYTLISSILFDDPGVHDFFQKAIQDKFKNQINKFKQLSPMVDNYFLAKILGDQQMQSYFQPTIVGLFNKKADQVNYFQKTIKMFTKLPNKFPPILKLKLLAEVEKQFLKQLKTECSKRKIEMVYDRLSSQLMASWLLSRDKKIGESSLSSIILAYAFVHTAYRLGAKGSTILSFVQTVQKILSWSIPVQ